MSDLDLHGESMWLPEGPAPGADLSMIRPGVVVELDVPGNRIRVAYNGGSGTWMSALPGMYTVGRTCWVLCNPMRGGRGELVLSQIEGGSPFASRTATLVSMSTGDKTAVVTMDGASYTVPYIQTTYTLNTLVWVLCNPSRWGAPELVMGSWAPTVAPTPTPDPAPVPVPPTPPNTQQVRTTIRPQWSGSWRSSAGAWDRWNTGRFGGRSDLYQGSSFGSGPMTGLATYGDQLANLGAISIDSIGVSIIANEGSGMPGPPLLQASPHGAQPGGAPATSGSVIAGALLPEATREAMRTGATKGIALVGGGYYGARGTSHPQGMALDVLYTRSA